jgi:DNA modification methylase
LPFIGIELDRVYLDEAVARVKQALSTLKAQWR